MNITALAGLAAMLAATSFTTLSSQAATTDAKTIPAAVCVPSNAVGVRMPSGAIMDASLTLSVVITCPILRDRTDLKLATVEVAVVDNSSLLVGEGEISCEVLASNKFGIGNPTSGGIKKTVGTNSNGTVLSLTVPAASNVDGTYGVRCTIPRRGAGDPPSQVGSFKYTETTPTD